MVKNVKTIKSIFVIFQSAMLVCTTGVIIFSLSMNYIEKNTQTWMEGLDNMAHLIVGYIRAGNEFVLAGHQKDFLIYGVNQKDGHYAFVQGKRSPEEEKLWERYRIKLVYEMQKQQRGWVFYPQKKKWDFNKPQRVIRYIPIEEKGLIVALETFKQGDWTILKGILNVQFCFFIFMTVAGATIFYWYLTNRGFESAQRMISDTVESSLINLSNEDFFNESYNKDKTKVDPLPEDFSAKKSSSLQGTVSSGEQQILKSKIKDDADFLSKGVQSKETKEPLASNEKKFDEIPEIEPFDNSSVEKKDLNSDEAEDVSDDKFKINRKSIKSSILKKLIKDIHKNP